MGLGHSGRGGPFRAAVSPGRRCASDGGGTGDASRKGPARRGAVNQNESAVKKQHSYIARPAHRKEGRGGEKTSAGGRAQ